MRSSTSTLKTIAANASKSPNITPIAPNPHYVSIEDNKTNFTTAGTIVDVDVKTKTIAVLCQDRKVLRMSNVDLYKSIDRPFTKNYISREVKVGSILL